MHTKLLSFFTSTGTSCRYLGFDFTFLVRMQYCLSMIQVSGACSRSAGLSHFDILGPHRCIVPNVRTYLKARTCSKKLFPWRPLGVENPGPRNWQDRVKSTGGTPHWRAQYEWLETRYKYLHDRRTVVARREKQRTGYHKQLRRWPMLYKGRKRRRL